MKANKTAKPLIHLSVLGALMAQTISNIDRLLTHFRKNTDRVISMQALSEKIMVGEDELQDDLKKMVGGEMVYEIGEGRYMLSNNSELVAYEIFRDIAPNISFEEYVKYKDEEHVLMRMSRDRNVVMSSNIETDEVEVKRRGNHLR